MMAMCPTENKQYSGYYGQLSAFFRKPGYFYMALPGYLYEISINK